MSRRYAVGVTLRQQFLPKHRAADGDHDDYIGDFESMVDLCKERVALYEHSARWSDREQAGIWRARLRRWETFVAARKAQKSPSIPTAYTVPLGLMEAEEDDDDGGRGTPDRPDRPDNPGFGSD